MLANVVMACLWAPQGTAPPTPPALTAAEGGRVRFADAILREAVMMLSPTDILPIEIEAAIYMSRRSALMCPDNPERWRMVLAISSLAAPMLPKADEVSREAIARLSTLCPEDEVMRLRRVVGEIERRETAPDRVKAYEAFTTPEALKVVGTAVGSRLTYDLALLQARIGDTDAFARNLERALVLSPAFPAAAETAAGFIAQRVNDPVAECELLVTAAMANPTEARLWSRLSAQLMQEGASDAAVRVCGLALDCAKAQDAYIEVIDLMTGELALALWGAGRVQDALRVVDRRLSDNRNAFADLVAAMNPGLTTEEAATVHGPVSTLLKTIEATLRTVTQDADRARAVTEVVSTVVDRQQSEARLKQQRQTRGLATQDDLGAAARNYADLLDAATTAALLGGDKKTIDQALTEAKNLGRGDDTAEQFEAWSALNSGLGPEARDRFAKVRSQSPAILFGAAKALAVAGDPKGAARQYLALAVAQRGTVIGLLAAHELRSIIGQPLPPSEFVARLDGVVASIPSLMERYLTHELPVMTLAVDPEHRTTKPFDTIWYTLTLRNVSHMTLAVTPQGPIKEHVLLQPRVLMPGALVIDRMTPDIIPFDRAIELSPGESMSMRWNFGWTGVGYRAALRPVGGAIVEFRGAANFVGGVGLFKVGPFGVEPDPQGVEIEGVRVTPEWVAAAIASASSAATDEDMVNLVLLAFALRDKLIAEESIQPAWQAISEGYGKLPVDAQSWVVMTTPTGLAEMSGVLTQVRATTSGDVRASYLLNYCKTTDDPQLAAAVRSGDEFGMFAALVVQARFLREAARAEEKMRGAKQESVGGTRDAANQVGKEGSGGSGSQK